MHLINGVDTTAVESLAKRFQDHPEDAIAPWSSTVVWQEGFHVEVASRNHAPIVVDEPEWLAGTNRGPNPVELLLGALGACLTSAFIAVASLSSVPINSLETTVSGDVDLQVFLGLKEGHAGFERITVQFVVDSPADDEQIRQIGAQAAKISPVQNTLERAVRVDHRYDRPREINDGSPKA